MSSELGYYFKCGFYIVEFQNERNSSEDIPDDFIGDGGDGMFIFRKEMKNDLREIVHPDYIAEVMNILQNK